MVCFSICTSPCKVWLFMFVFLLTTLNTHFIWSFSASIWFKQSKHALNIDTNGLQKHKKTKTQKNFLKRQKSGAKTCFYISTHSQNTVRYILPSYHIMSDSWASYANTANIQNGIYMHSVVIHDQHFLDPNDPEVHAQTVENMWMLAKRKMWRQFGTSRELFPSYIHEFILRNKFRNDDMTLFCRFLATVADNKLLSAVTHWKALFYWICWLALVPTALLHR